MLKRSSTQKDTQQLARSVLDAIVPDAEPATAKPEKNPAAVALGRLGGLKGGKARAAKLSRNGIRDGLNLEIRPGRNDLGDILVPAASLKRK